MCIYVYINVYINVMYGYFIVLCYWHITKIIVIKLSPWLGCSWPFFTNDNLCNNSMHIPVKLMPSLFADATMWMSQSSHPQSTVYGFMTINLYQRRHCNLKHNTMVYKLYFIYSQVQVHETYIHTHLQRSIKLYIIIIVFLKLLEYIVHTQYKHLLVYNVSAKSKQIL